MGPFMSICYTTVPMTLNDPERPDARYQIFEGISVITPVPFYLERKKWEDRSVVPVMSAIRDTLHWLTYPQRVTFKLCLTTYKCLRGLAPPYLTRFCTPPNILDKHTVYPIYLTPLTVVAGRTQLRSAHQHKLFVPRTSTSTLGPWAFCSSGPSSWNALPRQLRDPAISINIFRQSLKTYLFNSV